MIRTAIISDIHANEFALLAVLNDIASRGVDRIYCLGDFIGYGPKPIECAKLIMERIAVCILGNHDQAALFDPDRFNPQALQSVYWTRAQIEADSSGDDIFEFIGNLPSQHREDDLLFVHGSPSGPTEEYLFPEDIWDYPGRLARSFSLLKPARYAFCGHTHLPGIFRQVNADTFAFKAQSEFADDMIELSQYDQAIINVGSVGQPRDNNRDSCYVLLEKEGDQYSMQYRRVRYDAEATAELIFQNPDIADRLGERLLSGR